MKSIAVFVQVQSDQTGNGGNWPSKVPGHKSGGGRGNRKN